MSTQKQTSYFNLHTSGIGYLNDVRIIETKGGDIVACRIAALVGPSDKPEYRYFDMNATGDETESLIRRCKDAIDAKKKVLVSFVMADMRVETFTYKNNSQYRKKGDTGVSLKGRLIQVKSIKIDGESKYVKQSDSE